MNSKNHLFNDRLLRISIYIHSCLDDLGNEGEADFIFDALNISNPLDSNLKKVIALMLDSESQISRLFWDSFCHADINLKKTYSPFSTKDIYSIMRILEKNSVKDPSLIKKFEEFIQSNNLLISSSNANVTHSYDADIAYGGANAVTKINPTFKKNYLSQYKNDLFNAFCLIHGISPYKLTFKETNKNKKEGLSSEQVLNYFQKKGLLEKIEDSSALAFFELNKEASEPKNIIVENLVIHSEQINESIDQITDLIRKLRSSQKEFANIWDLEVNRGEDTTYENRGKAFTEMFLLSLNFLRDALQARKSFLSRNDISSDELCLLVDQSTNKSITTDLKKGILKPKVDPVNKFNMQNLGREIRYKNSSISRRRPLRKVYIEYASAKDWAEDKKRQYKFKETMFREMPSKDIYLSDLKNLYKKFSKIFSTASIKNDGYESLKKKLEAEGVDNIEERIAAGQYTEQTNINNGLGEANRLRLLRALRLEKTLDKTFITALANFYHENKSIFDEIT